MAHDVLNCYTYIYHRVICEVFACHDLCEVTINIQCMQQNRIDFRPWQPPSGSFLCQGEIRLGLHKHVDKSHVQVISSPLTLARTTSEGCPCSTAKHQLSMRPLLGVRFLQSAIRKLCPSLNAIDHLSCPGAMNLRTPYSGVGSNARQHQVIADFLTWHQV